MLNGEAAKLLRIHLSEGDARDGMLMHEAILGKCHELGIAGATVFRGLEGYGETAEVHRHRLLHHDQPLVIVVVDDAAKLSLLIPEVEAMMQSGMMAMSDVKALRVKKSPPRDE
jgi:PII-like signaling protein